MKSKFTGLSLIALGFATILIFAAYGPFAKNMNVPDFIKGFSIGFGLIIGSAIVVLLLKKIKDKSNRVSGI